MRDAVTEGSTRAPISSYLEWSDEGRSAIWRYVVAVVLGFVLWTLGSAPAVLLLQDFLSDPATESVAFEYTFVIGFVAVPLIVWLLLGRPGWSVALPAWPPRLLDYGLGIGIQWVVMTVMYLALVLPFGRLSYRGWDAEMSAGLPILVATIVGFAIQTGFEELYFRGLVAQATRRLVKWTPAVIGVQALFFAQLHVGNVEAWGGGITAMLPYLAAALALGWAAWRTGSLLISMGLHMGNNLFLVLFVNTEGDVIQSVAPLVAQTPEPARAIAFAVGQALLAVAAVELVVRRRAARAAGAPSLQGDDGPV